MTRPELRAIVKQVKYKPGWRFAVVDMDADTVVTIRGRAQDTYAKHKKIVPLDQSWWIAHSRLLTLTHHSVLLGIKRVIDGMEAHETAEWLRYRGTRPFDPHK